MFPTLNVKRFCCVAYGGRVVSRDVMLRIRSSQFLVPATRRGIETSGSFVCVIRGFDASADCSPLDKFDVGGSSGAATHSFQPPGPEVRPL